MPDTSPIAGAEVPAAGAAESSANRLSADDFRAAIAQVITIIRPAIQADQGDIFLRDTDQETGVVSVELIGACIDCPASTQTLKQGLERILKQRVEGVTEVRHVGEALAGAAEGTPVSI